VLRLGCSSVLVPFLRPDVGWLRFVFIIFIFYVSIADVKDFDQPIAGERWLYYDDPSWPVPVDSCSGGE
jgi:hypothetical protein